ncbi:hypothetical protein N7462_000792 [Penicillium macrosclerotiorum]|uniref:uncharacterized protein n=1 Tax=Penicillium macrosclerotiorum TaxID=303699 RepID=UPI00254699D2|nr:uncharacterized protein N7462_000792 [Penicillium macrosclerotiorum]KAJ5698787.1 hypothetical protein N7462_000792 [Penicillium macrosclerotiorum]
MATATLSDDVFREDTTTASFEADMAALCGHEAGAFVITGTMANQLAIRTLLPQPPHAVLADSHAHIIHFEGGMSGASMHEVRASNGRYMTLEDIIKRAILTDDVHKCPTRVISIENTAGGCIVPLIELRRISEWAHRHGMMLHLDGARLWEAVAARAGSLYDYCTPCDLVSLDFSKNLGAPMGAMVLGSVRLVAQLRRLRKSIGGGMRQSGVLAAAARHAVEEQFGFDIWESHGKLSLVHDEAKRVGRLWKDQGGMLLRPVETNQVWVDLKHAGIEIERWNWIGKKHGIRLDGKRIVFHHQISGAAITQLEKVFCEVLEKRARL